MKKEMAIAIFLGAAGLAGAALAEDIPPPPPAPMPPRSSGPPTPALPMLRRPRPTTRTGARPRRRPRPLWLRLSCPAAAGGQRQTASGQPAAPQGWAPPPPPYGGYYGPRYGYYDGDSTYGRGYGHGRGAGRGHMNGNFSFGGGADFGRQRPKRRRLERLQPRRPRLGPRLVVKPTQAQSLKQ